MLNLGYLKINVMDFNIESRKNSTVIEILTEKLDTHIAPALKVGAGAGFGQGRKEYHPRSEECQYCDSSGLSAILVANRLCKNAGGTFVLCGLNEAVERLITISQLDTVLSITGSVS
ncbi:MAG: STAS domain-containing protein [Bacteroidales bacterium]|nr:STAS domain-containing protein [Bacteroidales bacterium]